MKTVVLLAALLLAACHPDAPARAADSQSVAVWSAERARPQLVVGRFEAAGETAEAAARAFLAANAAWFHLDHPALTLELASVRHGLAGDYLRFEQRQAGRPVFTGDVVVLVTSRPPFEVLTVNLSQREEATAVTGSPELAADRARDLALAHVGATPPFRVDPAVSLGVWVPDERGPRKGSPGELGAPALAWHVTVSTERPVHDWVVFVDARSGAVLATRDRVVFVDGSGMVFDANPVASTGDTALSDNNDATSAALDAARFTVTLPRLDGSGYTRGTWVDARSANASNRVQSSTNTFHYTRDQSPSFEQVNVYYHLDRVQARFQALGVANANASMQVAVVDAQNSDNSYFSGTTINYGKGGVDDAEDGDIVVHEYGHAVQNAQVNGWGGGDEGSMGEGFGDYLAGSMAEVLSTAAGHTPAADPACVGDWDAVAYSTARPPCLRRLDGTKHSPEGETGEVHDDGEIWAAALWGLRAQLGPDVTDRLVLESHFLLGRSATFFTAAQALVTADTNVNGGAHAAAIRRRMIQQGLSRALTVVDAGVPVASLAVSIDNPRGAGGTYASELDHTQTYVVPGASALRVHFTRVDTEVNNQCLSRWCDNVYLTNADGDLFQVLGGSAMDVTSAPVSGDRVSIRLVTDVNTEAYGYHVDRIDVLGVVDGGVIDGGMFPDGGVSVPPDAGQPDAGAAADAAVPDAGSGSEVDAGPLEWAQAPQLGKAAPSGCGCATGSELWVGLLALGGLLRRRRAGR